MFLLAAPEDAQDNADKQDGGQSNAEVKSNGKEDKKGRRRDWESRKGTGLGAFVDRMGGEGETALCSDVFKTYCKAFNFFKLS